MRKCFYLSISIKRVVGTSLVILGMGFAVQFCYLTNGPFVETSGTITDRSLLLGGGENKALISYSFKVDERDYEGTSLLPVSYYPNIVKGKAIPIYYLYWNPELNSFKVYPYPTPLVQVSLVLMLIGIVLIFYTNKHWVD